MSHWTDFRDKALKPAVSPILAVAGGVAGFAFGGPAGLMVGASLGMSLGSQTMSAYETSKYNKDSLKIQNQALQQQSAELERQKKIEIERQKRENQQLMNSVSALTNTAYSGVSSPTIDYDKYGDLG